MIELARHQEICQQFAALFSYPDSQVAQRAAECAEQLQGINTEASNLLGRFSDSLAACDASSIEETFTKTFDLQPLCHLYVGYQLCGESQQRTVFMIKLAELYRRYSYLPGNELPDHLSEVLGFLGSINDRECRQEIIQDGLLPALEKMAMGIELDNHPYMDLLRSLQSFLIGAATTESKRLATDRQKECLS